MPLGIMLLDCYTEIQVPPCDENYNYECTVTFNPTLYTVASAYNEGLKLVEEEMIKWLEPTTTEQVIFVTEYQKSSMAHYHILISSTEQLPITLRANIVKGLQRIAGRSTFKAVIDLPAFLFYLEKDLEKNFNKSNIPHLKTYYR